MNEHEIQIPSEYDDLDKYKNTSGDIVYCKKDTKIWHNPYGPAVICKSGHKEYWVDGVRHRLDGPAIIHTDGTEYYVINSSIVAENKNDFYKFLKQNSPFDYTIELDDDMKVKNINKQDKINEIKKKNSLVNELDNNSINIIKTLMI